MSGVYIHGMEMPTNELMESTVVWVYPNGYAIVFKDRGKMQQYTKAIPVPAHGRLIDANALQRVTIEQQNNAYNIKAAPRNWAYAFCAFEEIVCDAPTIIPASKEG